MRRALTTLVMLLLLLPAGVSLAQVTSEPISPYPDPDKFARGLYGEAEVGALVFVGEAGGSLGAGAGLGARVGYDLFRWVALQLHLFGSTHTTHFPNMPQSEQILQLYQGTAEVKLTLRHKQLAAGLLGGVGLARLSSNLLGTTGLTEPDVQNTMVILGGLGVDYHTMSRHFSFGVAGTFARYARVRTAGAIAATAYVRYTF